MSKLLLSLVGLKEVKRISEVNQGRKKVTDVRREREREAVEIRYEHSVDSLKTHTLKSLDTETERQHKHLEILTVFLSPLYASCSATVFRFPVYVSLKRPLKSIRESGGSSNLWFSSQILGTKAHLLYR